MNETHGRALLLAFALLMLAASSTWAQSRPTLSEADSRIGTLDSEVNALEADLSALQAQHDALEADHEAAVASLCSAADGNRETYRPPHCAPRCDWLNDADLTAWVSCVESTSGTYTLQFTLDQGSCAGGPPSICGGGSGRICGPRFFPCPVGEGC